MDANRINDMVDRKVIQSLVDGISIGVIQSELRLKIRNFTKTIETSPEVDFQDLYNKEFSEIPTARHRYGITYIKQCEKRIKDLNWLLMRKSDMKRYSNSEIFKLIQFKEKLMKNPDLPF